MTAHDDTKQESTDSTTNGGTQTHDSDAYDYPTTFLDTDAASLIGTHVVVTSLDGDERDGVITDVSPTPTDRDDRQLTIRREGRTALFYVGEHRSNRVRLARGDA